MDEPSRALPAHFYRDPADVAQRNELDALGCHACSKHSSVLGKVLCTDARNEKQRGVPFRGHLCQWFIERD